MEDLPNFFARALYSEFYTDCELMGVSEKDITNVLDLIVRSKHLQLDLVRSKEVNAKT